MNMFVAMDNKGNIDFFQDPNRRIRGKKKIVKVKSFEEASKICRKYIEDNGLGGGNWTGGAIRDDSGAEIGRVSYNGRVWPPGPSKVEHEPLFDPYS